MDELVASVKRVATIMTEIAAASDEQSSGIEQINKAITQMDNVVQMNASLVEEATAAAASMASQATGLAHAVAQFQVLDEVSPGHAPAIGAAAASRSLGRAQERAPVVGARREPLLTSAAPATATTAEEDDWKEF